MNKFFKYPLLIIIVICVITVALGLQLKNLVIDNDTTKFMPKSHPARQEFIEIEDTYGDSMMMAISVKFKEGYVYNRKNLEFIETDDIISILPKADIMLCDTSSVMLMFMAQRRPVVTYRNRSSYGNDHLLNVEDVSQIENALEIALTRPENLLRRIDKFIDDIHPARDGKSSDRVLSAIEERLSDNQAISRSKPVNVLRNLKSIPGLYFK